MLAVICKKFRGGYLRGMSENKNITVKNVYQPEVSVFLILVFLFIVTFWGEPDLLDMAIAWMGR